MKKLSKQYRKDAAKHLVFAMLIYSNAFKGRGQYGCVMDSLRILYPKVARLIGDGVPLREVYDRFWLEHEP